MRVGFLFICAVRVLEINNVSYPFLFLVQEVTFAGFPSAKLMLS